jgi:hypothetical protein
MEIPPLSPDNLGHHHPSRSEPASLGIFKGVGFTSPTQLREAIDKFVKVYNQKAAPFEWKKAVVHPASPKRQIR